MRRPGAWLLAWALVACAEPGQVELVGYQSLVRGGEGGPSVVFNDAFPPVISLTDTHLVDVQWNDTPLEVEEIDAAEAPGRRVRVTTRGVRGEGILRVNHTHGMHAFRARWDPPREALAEAGDALELRAAEARAAAKAGQLDRAWGLFLEASELALARGLTTRAIDLRVAAGHHALKGQRVLLVAAEVPTLEDILMRGPDPLGRRQADYLIGRVFMEMGRFNDAWHHMNAAWQGAQAAGDQVRATTFGQQAAVTLTLQGRHVEALAQNASLPPPTDPQAAWYHRSITAWITQQAILACAIEPPDPGPAHALAELARTAHELPAPDVATLWFFAAEAWLADGQVEAAAEAAEAGRHLDPAGGADPLVAELVGAHLTLEAGDALTAAERFARVHARALDDGQEDHAWRALHGEGAALQAANQPNEALAAWIEGLESLEEVGQSSSLRLSRSSFLADRRRLLEDAVELLLAAGHLEEAIRLVDRHGAPTLRALQVDSHLSGQSAEAAAAWQARVRAQMEARWVALEQQAGCARQPLDAQAACHEAATQALRAVADAEEATWTTLTPPHTQLPADLTTLLGPGEGVLVHLRRTDARGCLGVPHRLLLTRGGVEVVGEDPAGWPPLDHLYVTGGEPPTDRPASRIPSIAWLARGRATSLDHGLVVSNPTLDLPAADTPPLRGQDVVHLAREAATPEAVLAHLPGSRHFHYDGHGDLAPENAWSARLRLHGGDLTITDVLSTPLPMGTVVLAGCRTGTQVPLSRYESIGIAEAFLLAGADRVIAPDRPVRDEDAQRFIAAFYAAGGAEQPARAFFATTRALAGTPAGEGWRYFGRP